MNIEFVCFAPKKISPSLLIKTRRCFKGLLHIFPQRDSCPWWLLASVRTTDYIINDGITLVYIFASYCRASCSGHRGGSQTAGWPSTGSRNTPSEGQMLEACESTWLCRAGPATLISGSGDAARSCPRAAVLKPERCRNTRGLWSEMWAHVGTAANTPSYRRDISMSCGMRSWGRSSAGEVTPLLPSGSSSFNAPSDRCGQTKKK